MRGRQHCHVPLVHTGVEAEGDKNRCRLLVQAPHNLLICSTLKNLTGRSSTLTVLNVSMFRGCSSRYLARQSQRTKRATNWRLYRAE